METHTVSTYAVPDTSTGKLDPNCVLKECICNKNAVNLFFWGQKDCFEHYCIKNTVFSEDWRLSTEDWRQPHTYWGPPGWTLGSHKFCWFSQVACHIATSCASLSTGGKYHAVIQYAVIVWQHGTLHLGTCTQVYSKSCAAAFSQPSLYQRCFPCSIFPGVENYLMMKILNTVASQNGIWMIKEGLTMYVCMYGFVQYRLLSGFG